MFSSFDFLLKTKPSFFIEVTIVSIGIESGATGFQAGCLFGFLYSKKAGFSFDLFYSKLIRGLIRYKRVRR
jgi:hypothetical protein